MARLVVALINKQACQIVGDDEGARLFLQQRLVFGDGGLVILLQFENACQGHAQAKIVAAVRPSRRERP